MDRVLKQRLVGAAILIALAVIFVPMWVGTPQRDQHEERRSTIELPEPPADREVRRIPLGDRGRADEPEPSPAEGESEASVPELPEPEVEAIPELEAEPEATAAEDTEPDTTVSPVVAEPIPEPVSEAPESVAQEPESEPVAEVTAPEPDSPSRDESAAPAAQGDWLVQVASFGNADSANNLAGRVQALGYQTVIDTAARGEGRLHRVRAGPFAQRDQADQARARIANGIAGVEPAVINIGGAGGAAGGGTPTVGGAYSVQVGVFTREENATALKDRLNDQGFTSFIDSQTSNGRTTWRVRAGPVVTREQAEQLRDRLRRESGIEGMVVGHP